MFAYGLKNTQRNEIRMEESVVELKLFENWFDKEAIL